MRTSTKIMVGILAYCAAIAIIWASGAFLAWDLGWCRPSEFKLCDRGFLLIGIITPIAPVIGIVASIKGVPERVRRCNKP